MKRWIIIWKQQITTNQVILELTPPHDAKQDVFATEQFLTTLHAIGKPRALKDKILGNKKLFSLEVVSSKEKGIRFLLRVAVDDEEVVTKNLRSFLPSIKIKEISDNLISSQEEKWQTVELPLVKHFALPLKIPTDLNTHDPIAYITGQMTKLAPDELTSLQLVLTPITSYTHRSTSNEIQKMKYLVTQGLDVSSALKQSSGILGLIGALFLFLVNLGVFVLLAPITMITSIMLNDKGDSLPWWIFQKGSSKKQQQLSQQKQHLQEMVNDKVRKELFEVTIRLAVAQDSQEEAKRRISGLFTSFATFTNKGLQSFSTRKRLVFPFFFFRNRLLSFFTNPILSTTEVAAIFHFPYSSKNKTEDVVTSLSNQLSAPLSLKQNDKKLDNVFANNVFAETITPIGLTKDERRRHMYIIGATGTGKTTMLATMIKNDMANDKGLCVIDPHGDLIQKCLESVP